MAGPYSWLLRLTTPIRPKTPVTNLVAQLLEAVNGPRSLLQIEVLDAPAGLFLVPTATDPTPLKHVVHTHVPESHTVDARVEEFGKIWVAHPVIKDSRSIRDAMRLANLTEKFEVQFIGSDPEALLG